MKKNIALITGGFSGEAEISYKTVITIDKNLDRDLFNVFIIDITQDGWFYIPKEGEKISVNKNDFSILVGGQPIHFDAAFMALHGTPGEDGKLQGYLDIIGIPYTCSGVATSAITFNKRQAVAVARMSGVHVANSLVFYKDQYYNASAILEQLEFPVFVKPNNGGSSIGMTKVETKDMLLVEQAMEKAFKEDTEVLVEEMISGREFTIGVYKTGGEIKTLPITEVKAHEDMPFFDFTAKYKGKSSEITPAVVEEHIAQSLRREAMRIYALFNCKGVIRIDFIYNEGDSFPYMLEVNTVPGQSAASIVPQQVVSAGMQLKDFYTALVKEILP